MIGIPGQGGKPAGYRLQGHAPWTARWRASSRCLLAACSLVSALAAGRALAQPVSHAETLLFETDHLARTKAPAALLYTFRRVSNVEPEFSDTVELALTRKDGQLHARLRFLSGTRKHELPDLDNAHGNPVLLGFLERDIAEMKRLTGGSTTYFRKRIRLALANSAQVTEQSIRFQGKQLQAQAVRIQPYLDDRLHARFEPYVHKTYTFILSDAVPGGVYQLRTSLANSAAPTITASADGGKAPIMARPGMMEYGKNQPGAAKPAAGKPGPGAAGAAAQAARETAAAVIDETLTLDRISAAQQ